MNIAKKLTIIYKMGLIITVNEQKDARRFGSYWYYTKKEKILDKLFFIDEEPSIMEIKDYFGCEREERPKQLEILGEKTIEILEKCKRNMEKILYSVRVLDKKTKSIGIIRIIFDNDNLYTKSTWGKRRLPLGAYFINLFEKVGFTFVDDIIWDKGEVQSERNKNGDNPYPMYQYPINCYEHILIFHKHRLDMHRYPCPICGNTRTLRNR